MLLRASLGSSTVIGSIQSEHPSSAVFPSFTSINEPDRNASKKKTPRKNDQSHEQEGVDDDEAHSGLAQ
ncbi:uncharacterized protein PITG_03921 [Phytophthora infestans T30-4]|uniref:Uncharacterized protein n=1 Tax=Phytophthora infestans (strain T30-4) TaxID=403677 RepID=D0MYV8_PHYIT|nr:uncharacterized protein PITG_03921 [Phytophthora infestans T30-4]EEY66356.1 hypothetical protein PITG_03921 [Phytophthora infestans T30-4]|eukprot:XP_002906955.1 hypothetical protein PITG_03921 [Phytophthora infestans T30-4]